jgi:peptidoglycan endopeptidase LytF
MPSTYTVVKGDTLSKISRKFGLSVDTLKSLNSLTSSNLSIGQVLRLQPAAAPTPVAASFSSSKTYTVVQGDTLFGISRKTGLSVDALKSLNGLTSNNLSIGQVLVLGQNSPPPQPNPTPTPPSTRKTYTVVKGDTLFGISRKTGVAVDTIKSLNGLTSNNLSIGQVLIIGQSSQPSNPNPPDSDPTPTPTPTTPVNSGNYLDARATFEPDVVQESDFRRYFMRVRVADGTVITANMRDNLRASRFMVYPHGIMYAGQSRMELALSTIESVGLNAQQAAALQFVSTHEGSFDAINSYDKAIFSYGFIQFAGAAAVGASLNRLLSNMEANAPAAFQNIFKRVGIDTEGTGNQSVVTVLNERGTRLRGDDAWFYIQENVPLYGAFIQAGFEPALVREQLRAANDLYVQPALNWKLDVTVGGLRIVVPQLRSVIRSEAALTVVIALAVNQGVGGMSKIVAASVGRIAQQMGLRTQQSLALVDEQSVVEDIAASATDDRISNRANSVLQSDLSFDKA